MILSALVARPSYGYQIKKGVERVLGGAFAINNNLLYPALRRFEEMGAVEKEIVRQDGKPDRHVYRATEMGEEILGEMLREFTPEMARNDAEFMIRVAFFDSLNPEDRRKILEARRKFLEEHMKHSEEMEPRAESSGHPYAARVVEFHRSRIEHELAWISDLAGEVQ